MVVRNCPWKSPGPNGFNLRSQIGIGNDTPLVVYQGRYDYERGLEELVMAGEYLDRAVIAFRGYGPNEDKLKKIADEKGLTEKKVFFLEPVQMSDLVPALHGADIGVIPYKRSFLDHLFASPNKVFEYLMAGLALLSNDLPEIKRIIRDYRVGSVFTHSEPRLIADAINRLSENHDRLIDMKRNARNTAKETFCWENEMETLLHCYTSMLAQ